MVERLELFTIDMLVGVPHVYLGYSPIASDENDSNDLFVESISLFVRPDLSVGTASSCITKKETWLRHRQE